MIYTIGIDVVKDPSLASLWESITCTLSLLAFTKDLTTIHPDNIEDGIIAVDLKEHI